MSTSTSCLCIKVEIIDNKVFISIIDRSCYTVSSIGISVLPKKISTAIGRRCNFLKCWVMPVV
jgi:hypothetical protein